MVAGEENPPVRHEAHGLLRLCAALHVDVHVWVATMTEPLIDIAIPLRRHAALLGESFSWLSPRGDACWKDRGAQKLFERFNAVECLITLSDGADSMKIVTTHPALPAALSCFEHAAFYASSRGVWKNCVCACSVHVCACGVH